MDMQSLKAFFKWMSIINFGILMWAGVPGILLPELGYAVTNALFPMSEEVYSISMYGGILLYKLLWIVFNVVPLIALHILDRPGAAAK